MQKRVWFCVHDAILAEYNKLWNIIVFKVFIFNSVTITVEAYYIKCAIMAATEFHIPVPTKYETFQR